MIERLQRIATTLRRFRLLILVLGIVSAGVFSLSLFQNPWLDGDVWLIPSLVALCWSLTLLSLTLLFINIPPRAEKSDGWRKRLSVFIRRGLLWDLALLFVILSLTVLLLSYQLLRTWFMA